MTEVRTRLPYALALARFRQWADCPDVDFDDRRNLLRGPGFALRLPLPCPRRAEGEPLPAYAARLPAEVPPHLVVLMQAGQAALGFGEGEDLIHHKVIRKYMVRKKRGKAQLTHLKTKGKSRAGSRIRLAQTEQFFAEINQKLHDWGEAETAERILFSCPVRMWPLLFGSRVPAAFDQRDERLIKVPLDVRVPDLAELERVRRYALAGHWTEFLSTT